MYDLTLIKVYCPFNPKPAPGHVGDTITAGLVLVSPRLRKKALCCETFAGTESDDEVGASNVSRSAGGWRLAFTYFAVGSRHRAIPKGRTASTQDACDHASDGDDCHDKTTSTYRPYAHRYGDAARSPKKSPFKMPSWSPPRVTPAKTPRCPANRGGRIARRGRGQLGRRTTTGVRRRAGQLLQRRGLAVSSAFPSA